MIEIGDRVAVHPETFDPRGEKAGKRKAATGRAVYVHPAGRFCVLEFEAGPRGQATIRESFQLLEGAIFQ